MSYIMDSSEIQELTKEHKCITIEQAKEIKEKTTIDQMHNDAGFLQIIEIILDNKNLTDIEMLSLYRIYESGCIAGGLFSLAIYTNALKKIGCVS